MEWKAIQYPVLQSTDRSILQEVIEISHRFNPHSLNRQIEACKSLFCREKVIDVAIPRQFGFSTMTKHSELLKFRKSRSLHDRLKTQDLNTMSSINVVTNSLRLSRAKVE